MRITAIEYGLAAVGATDLAISANQYLLQPALKAAEIMKRCDLIHLAQCGARAAEQFQNSNLPPPPELVQQLAHMVGMPEMLLLMAPALLASGHFFAKAWATNNRINSWR